MLESCVNEQARALLRSLLIIGAVIGLVLGAVATSVPWLFANFFTPDPAVIGEVGSFSFTKILSCTNT